MTGLEKIIKHIEDDASAAAKKLILQAKSDAEQVITYARADGDKLCAQIAEKSQSDVSALLSRAESAATLQKKKMILNAKQQIIGEIINKAKAKLMELPEKEYFDIILNMIPKHAYEIAGDLIFCETDIKRIPKEFLQRVNSTLAQLPGASLNVSEKVAQIDGGFVLKYGDVEENCSFEALLLTDKDALQDKISALLFEQHTA